MQPLLVELSFSWAGSSLVENCCLQCVAGAFELCCVASQGEIHRSCDCVCEPSAVHKPGWWLLKAEERLRLKGLRLKELSGVILQLQPQACKGKACKGKGKGKDLLPICCHAFHLFNNRGNIHCMLPYIGVLNSWSAEDAGWWFMEKANASNVKPPELITDYLASFVWSDKGCHRPLQQ